MGVSCCGEAKDQDVVVNSLPQTITSQPTFKNQPSYGFQLPSISPPPAVHNALPQNNFQQPLMTEFGGTSLSQATTTVPTFTGTTYNGSLFDVANGFSSVNHAIARPQSSHSLHSPPPQPNATIQNEGKMSVSIDFGVYPNVISLSNSHLFVQVQHSLVLLVKRLSKWMSN